MDKVLIDLPKYATKLGIIVNVGEIIIGAGTIFLASRELVKGIKLRSLLLK